MTPVLSHVCTVADGGPYLQSVLANCWQLHPPTPVLEKTLSLKNPRDITMTTAPSSHGRVMFACPPSEKEFIHQACSHRYASITGRPVVNPLLQYPQKRGSALPRCLGANGDHKRRCQLTANGRCHIAIPRFCPSHGMGRSVGCQLVHKKRPERL